MPTTDSVCSTHRPQRSRLFWLAMVAADELHTGEAARDNVPLARSPPPVMKPETVLRIDHAAVAAAYSAT